MHARYTAPLRATLLEDLAVTAVTAATVGRLMAATRLVAMAAPEFSIIRRAARRAVTAARRLAVVAALAAMATAAAPAAPWWDKKLRAATAARARWGRV